MSVDSWTRYQLRRKLFSIGEDFWIENDRGENVYKVDGKALRIRETFVLEDVNGTEQATVEANLIAIRPTMRGHDLEPVLQGSANLWHTNPAAPGYPFP